MKKSFSFPHIQQSDVMECGTTCLAIIFKYYGFYDIRHFLNQYSQINSEGIDLYTMSEIAEGFGFSSDGYQMEYQNFKEINLPCIIHYEGYHFVVVYKVTENRVWISDPAVGKYSLTKDEFHKKWNGIVLALNPTDEVFKHNELTELVNSWRVRRKNIWKAYYWSAIHSSKSMIWKIIGFTFLLLILSLMMPFFTQAIIDDVLVNDNIKLLYAILIGMGFVFISQVLISYGRNLFFTQVKIEFERSFFSNFYDHLIHLKQDYFDRHKREDFMNRFNENVKIREILNPAVLEALMDFVFTPIYILVLFYFNTVLGVFVMVFMIAYLSYAAYVIPKIKHLENIVFDAKSKTLGNFLDAILGIQSVKLLGIERLMFWKWKNSYTKALNKVFKTEQKYIQLNSIITALFYSSQATILWLGAYFTFKNQMTIGEYIAFIAIYTMVVHALLNMRQLWYFMAEIGVSFDRINDIFTEDRIDPNQFEKVSLGNKVGIRFEKVSFKYLDREEHFVLKEINFTIEPGSFVGIVGRNGSGKSTLVKLLANLYPDYDGKIWLNNVDLQNVNRRSLLSKFSYIPQDVYLFDATLKDNIRYGNPNATDEQVFMAAQWAELDEYVKSQYLGFNVRIGNLGVNLSGGQKLKVAFARLFLSNPEVIILDEASSALDVETEQKLMKKIKEHFPDSTIISIAHRLHTLKDASKILVLDKGSVKQQGTHDELSKSEGLYRNFLETYVNF